MKYGLICIIVMASFLSADYIPLAVGNSWVFDYDDVFGSYTGTLYRLIHDVDQGVDTTVWHYKDSLVTDNGAIKIYPGTIRESGNLLLFSFKTRYIDTASFAFYHDTPESLIKRESDYETDRPCDCPENFIGHCRRIGYSTGISASTVFMDGVGPVSESEGFMLGSCNIDIKKKLREAYVSGTSYRGDDTGLTSIGRVDEVSRVRKTYDIDCMFELDGTPVGSLNGRKRIILMYDGVTFRKVIRFE